MALGIIQALDSASLSEDADRISADIYNVCDVNISLINSIREATSRQDTAWLRIYRAEYVQQARLLVALIRDLAPL
jgi:hypothetical protein